jgi:hypothetical protein
MGKALQKNKTEGFAHMAGSPVMLTIRTLASQDCPQPGFGPLPQSSFFIWEAWPCV